LWSWKFSKYSEYVPVIRYSEYVPVIRYSEYVPVIPALVIRREERMRPIMSSVACLALTRVFTLPYIRHHFRNTFIENKNV